LREVGLFQFLNPAFIKNEKMRGFSNRVNLCVNPKSHQIFIADLTNEKLHILDLPSNKL